MALNLDAVKRIEEENERQHRAFLLWCMMSREGSPTSILGRSKNAVHRAVGVSHTTVGRWITKKNWVRRCLAAGRGMDAEETAAELYRRLYLEDYGESELPYIIPMCRIDPLKPWANEASDAQQETVKTLEKVVEEPVEVERPNIEPLRESDKEDRLQRSKNRHAATNRALRGLTHMALKAFREQIHAGKVKLKVGDLVTIKRLEDELMAEERRLAGAEGDAAKQQEAPESVRVRLAREEGGDVLKAVHDDLLELTTAVEQLRASAEQDRLREQVLERARQGEVEVG